VARRLEADVCSIYLSDPDFQHLTLSATIGLDPGAVGRVRLSFGEGLVGLAAERCEPVATEHASLDPHYRYFAETREECFESLLAAPLIVQSVTIGVLVIQTKEPRTFDEPDVGLLQTCAQLLAPVVINAQLLALVATTEEQRAHVVSAMARAGIATLDEGKRTGPREESNVEFKGIPTARGVAIGPVHRVENPVDLARLDYEPSEDPDCERRDLMAALLEARHEVEATRAAVRERFGPEFAAVFHTHVQILEDKGFVGKLERAVEQKGDALRALRSVLNDYRRTFDAIEDPYFRERGSDIEDVGRRVMEKLLGVRRHEVALQQGAVVVVDQMLPGLFAQLEMDKVGAIVSEHGGTTSHGAIFARTLEIPTVTGVAGICGEVRSGETAIVDGGNGRIYLSPDEVLCKEYQRAQQEYAISVEHLDAVRERPAETLDGRRVVLTANVGLLNDLRLIEKHGAEGAGLFRTELLALAHRGFPGEEEQLRLYERACRIMGSRRLTIRTLDLGADKGIPNIGLDDEDNPQLGCRSIRLTLENVRAFQAQLRAILRASADGNLRLLFPMISSIGELREARQILDDVRRSFDEQGIAYDRQLPVGVMIEVPSAAIISDALAAECDFFSIGTNDLTQYTLAVDRGNERVAHLYHPLHPAVLTLIDRSVRAAQRAGIPVSVCGEAASNPLAVPLLVGLGIGELSGAPSSVPLVKEIIRAIDSEDVAEDARRALSVASIDEVNAIAAARLRATHLLEHPDIGTWLRGIIEQELGLD